jgi:hypothetical protein
LDHILKLEGAGLQALHDVVFPSIATGRTILFLGAGASVTDKKKFLSKELIDLYSVRKGINLETNRHSQPTDEDARGRGAVAPHSLEVRIDALRCQHGVENELQFGAWQLSEGRRMKPQEEHRGAPASR